MVCCGDVGRGSCVSDGCLCDLAGSQRGSGVRALGQETVSVGVVAIGFVVVVGPDAGLAVRDDGVCVGRCADALECCRGVVVCGRG